MATLPFSYLFALEYLSCTEMSLMNSFELSFVSFIIAMPILIISMTTLSKLTLIFCITMSLCVFPITLLFKALASHVISTPLTYISSHSMILKKNIFITSFFKISQSFEIWRHVGSFIKVY